MKSLKIYNLRKITIAIFALGAMASCSNDFTDRPSEDSISASNYYKNDEQVSTATDGMYYKTWFQFNNKFFYAISEVGSGNMYTNSSDVNAMRSFSITSSDAEMFSGWQSLWANVAQANYLINNLQRVADPSVSQSVINNALGEAYFMRATAYFYLVRLWGPVPIIVNNLDHVTNPQLNTNRVEDVYELVTRDYTQAISLLNSKVRGSSYADNAKVSKGSAKAMLAKVYLYLKDYTKARQLSEEVINMIARIAYDRKLGAKSINEILESSLALAEFEIASNSSLYESLIIDKSTIKDNKKYTLVKRKNN